MSWEKARQKITEGVNYTDTVPIPFGGETIELNHRLLHEGELLQIESSIDREALQQHQQSGESETEQRIKELQSKDELTTEEERELEELVKQFTAEQSGVMDSMGYETFEAFMEAGKKALVPSNDDINTAFDLDIEEQERRFGTVPNNRKQMKDALKTEMETMVDNQPYPIKFFVGQKAYAESLSLFEGGEGNTAMGV